MDQRIFENYEKAAEAAQAMADKHQIEWGLRGNVGTEGVTYTIMPLPTPAKRTQAELKAQTFSPKKS